MKAYFEFLIVSFFVIFALCLSGCGKDNITNNTVGINPIADCTLTLESTSAYNSAQGVTNNYIATFCLSNNSQKTISTVEAHIGSDVYNYISFEAGRKVYITKSYSTGNAAAIDVYVKWQ